MIGPPESHAHDHGWDQSQPDLSHTDSKGEVGQLPRGKSQSLVIRKRGFLRECRKLTHVENANHSVPGSCQAPSLCCYRVILSNNSFSPFCRWRNWDSKRSSHLPKVHRDWTGRGKLVTWLQNSCLAVVCQKLLHSFGSGKKQTTPTPTFVMNDILTHNMYCEVTLDSSHEILILPMRYWFYSFLSVFGKHSRTQKSRNEVIRELALRFFF